MSCSIEREWFGYKSGIIVLVLTLTLSGGFASAGMLTGTNSAISLAEIPLGEGNRSHDGGAKVIVEFLPASFLFSPDIEDFRVTSGGMTEDIQGTGSWIPSIRGGVRFDLGVTDLDITGGGGFLANNAMHAPFGIVDFALRFKPSKVFTIGPHFGLIGFSELEWDGNAAITFSGARGVIMGVVTTFEFSPAFLILTFDYLGAKFDVERTGGSWSANDTELDISGSVVQFGVGFRF
jgi:hypothetical protein